MYDYMCVYVCVLMCVYYMHDIYTYIYDIYILYISYVYIYIYIYIYDISMSRKLSFLALPAYSHAFMHHEYACMLAVYVYVCNVVYCIYACMLYVGAHTGMYVQIEIQILLVWCYLCMLMRMYVCI